MSLVQAAIVNGSRREQGADGIEAATQSFAQDEYVGGEAGVMIGQPRPARAAETGARLIDDEQDAFASTVVRDLSYEVRGRRLEGLENS